MRIAGYIYVVTILTLNFFIDEPWFFLLALTTFPVALVLLLKKPGVKKQMLQRASKETEDVKHSL